MLDLQSITCRLQKNKLVRRSLRPWGRLHIDRQLPFLVVYRRPADREDPQADRLIVGEASYLKALADQHQQTVEIVEAARSTLQPAFGAFLIVEVWTSKDTSTSRSAAARPVFRIHHTPETPPSLLQVLKEKLGEIRVLQKSARVRHLKTAQPWPMGLPALTEHSDSTLCIGIEVAPIFRNLKTGKQFPDVRRAVHRGLSLALRQTFFEFASHHTTDKPPHFHTLGRQAIVRAVKDVDRRFSQVVSLLNFMLLVTPANPGRAWSKFKAAGFRGEPEFLYRPIPERPADLKRKLYEIPVHRIEDPTLSDLYEGKRIATDRRITMLQDRSTPNFLYESIQLFGLVEDDLLNTAVSLLASIPKESRDDGTRLGAIALAKRARAEIARYSSIYPGFTPKVRIRKDLNGLIVSGGNLLIGRNIEVPSSRVEALFQHEIGTHLIIHYNSLTQPLNLVRSGMSGYEETQEGMAVLAEYLSGGLSLSRMRVLAARVLAVRRLTEHASFEDIFGELIDEWKFKPYSAFTITMRVWRGGGMTKDATYLKGLISILKYLKDDGDLDPLYSGRIALDQAPIIEELIWRGVLKRPPLKPRYLETAPDKLKELRDGLTVLDLI